MTRFTKRKVGDLAKDGILAGLSVMDVVNMVRALIPGCRITKKCVYYYRWELRRAGYEFA